MKRDFDWASAEFYTVSQRGFHRELLYCWVCIKSNCIGTLKLEAEIFSQNIALRSEFIKK
jgi:hypothetical protein